MTWRTRPTHSWNGPAIRLSCAPAALLILLFLLVPPLTAQKRRPREAAPAVQELAAERHHKLLLENEHVAVYELALAPGEATAGHRHQNAFLLIALTEGELVVGGKAPAVRAALGRGQMQIFKGEVEPVERNTGATPFRALVIELRHGLGQDEVVCGLDRPPCRDIDVGGDMMTGTYTVTPLFQTGALKAEEYALDPGVQLYPQHRFDHLMVPVEDAHLQEVVNSGEPVAREYKAGEVSWRQPVRMLKLINAGEERARFLTVECR